MKITQKITLTVIFLLFIIGFNSFIGLTQLSQMRQQLTDIAQEDIILTELITSIKEYQLKKALLFERLIRIAEEMSFEKIPDSRRKYLVDNVKFILNGFQELSTKGSQNIYQAKQIIKNGIQKAQMEDRKNDLALTNMYLEKIEQAHIRYDEILESIFNLAQKGNLQLTFTDMRRIRDEKTRLNDKLESFVEKIKKTILTSSVQSQRQENTARIVMLDVLAASFVISLILAFMLFRSISQPLRKLVSAVKQIGSGNYNVHIVPYHNDEIGEVSNAVNIMAQQLDENRREIEEKNTLLTNNLEITKEQKRDLEKINRALDGFVYTATHDIRSPLMGIDWYGSLLEKNYADKIDEKGKNCILGIRKFVDRINKLIDDLLLLTKISKIKNPYEEVNINNMLDHVMGQLEYNIHISKTQFRIDENLPTIQCDRIKLNEAFLNLISNGIKFASKIPGQHPVIEIGYKELANEHQFYIKDNGIGIDPKEHGQIFEIFRRAKNSEEYAGTGAGLSIVKSIIEDHGGKIWVDSQPGKGASFFFTIPKNLT